MRCERIALPAELYPHLRNSIIPLNNSYYISFFGFVKMHDTGKNKLRRKSGADARKDVITGKLLRRGGAVGARSREKTRLTEKG